MALLGMLWHRMSASPGTNADLFQESLSQEVLVVDPKDRRGAIAHVIGTARKELRLSIFRCDDFSILDALADAIDRKVRVRALLTPHAKGWKKRLSDLEAFLGSMGVEIERYGGEQHKYHAKYIVADDALALVASLNLTQKCLDETCDFILLSPDVELISTLVRLFDSDWWAGELPQGLSGRLIVGPDNARERFLAVLSRARRSVRIIDHRLSDPQVMALLRQHQESGVTVQVLGHGSLHGRVSHGRMIVVDEEIGVIGSMALSRVSLDARREVAVTVEDAGNVARLCELFDNFARKVPKEKLALSEFVGSESDEDD